MKNQRRFKAPNYSRGCLLAKAPCSRRLSEFGVSAANFGSALPARRGGAGRGFNARKQNDELLTSNGGTLSVVNDFALGEW
jgi:hypothetical protein